MPFFRNYLKTNTVGEYVIVCVISLRERTGQLFSKKEFIVFGEQYIAVRKA
jgi:hypothetical protein